MRSQLDQTPDVRPQTTLPFLRFDTGTFQEDVRLDALNTFSTGLYTYLPNNEGGSAPRLSLEAWVLDGIAAATLDYGPTVVHAPRWIDPNFEDMIFLRWVKSGRIQVEIGDERHEFGPGAAFLMQARHKLHCLDNGTSVSLRLPLDRIGRDMLDQAPIMRLPTETWQGRILLSALEALFDTLPDMATTDAPLFADQIAALVTSVLELDQHRDHSHLTIEANRTQAMRRFLLTHLSRPDLGVGDLQSQFNASRATVYRAFADLGGVSNFVRENRLAAIYRDLRMSTPARGAIRRIAEQYGLFDQTSFLRSFRAQYDVRPSEVLGAARVCKVSTPGPQCDGVNSPASLAAFWCSAH